MKGLRVIESFNSERQKQSISDISRATSLDRATCRRLILTLVHEGFAAQEDRLFRLTPRVLTLGYAYLRSTPFPNTIQSHLEQFSAEIGESSSASVLEGDEIIYVARASVQRVMSINLQVGSHLPTYCSSMGRALLSSLSDEDLREHFEHISLVPLTDKTCVDIDELIKRVKQVRELGYAMVDQELEEGLLSLAVPLLNSRGKVVAALNIGTNSGRISQENLIKNYLPKLQALQEELSHLITYD